MMKELQSDYPVPFMCLSTKFRRAGITLGLGVRHRNGHRMRGDWKWKSEPFASAPARPATNSDYAMSVAPNFLELKLKATAPNHIWVTYIPTGAGCFYLAGHKNLFSGDLVRTGGTATTTPLWKTSGDFSKMNWYITGASGHPRRGHAGHHRYIEYFTGGSGKQARLKSLSPAAFEQHFYQDKVAA